MSIVFKWHQTPLQLLKSVFSQWTQVTKVMLTTELCWCLKSSYGGWDIGLPSSYFFLYIFLFELFWVFLTSWTTRADYAFLLHGQREAHTGLRQLQSSSRFRIVIHQEGGKGRQGIAQTMLVGTHILLPLRYHRAHRSSGEPVPYPFKGVTPQKSWDSNGFIWRLCGSWGLPPCRGSIFRSLRVRLHGGTQES